MSTQAAPKRLCSSAMRWPLSAPARSDLFMKIKTGTRCRSSRRQSVSVWLCTPSVPLMTRMAQSMTCSARSASAEKSTWPGVSSRVRTASGRFSRASLEKMVMPRARSSESVSRKASR